MTDFRKFVRERGMNGFCFIVGGTVRDILAGAAKPKDIDIAMKGRAVRAARSFAQQAGGTFVLLDERFGTARVVRGDEHIDISRMRGAAIEEDLASRDITINAMAFPLSSRRLIDPFGGSEDLMKGVVRIVSEENLVHDPLRILRCYRFAAAYGFRIEKESASILEKLASLLKAPAAERITDELRKILAARGAGRVLERMFRDGALREVLPGFRRANLPAFRALEGKRARFFPFHEKLGHAAREMSFPLALAVLAAGSGGRATQRLVLSNKEKAFMERLSAYRARFRGLFSRGARGAALAAVFRDLEDETYAHLLFSYAFFRAGDEQAGHEFLEFSKAALSHYIKAVRPRLGRRPITGEDLKTELGLKPSPLFKEVLEDVELRWLKGEINSRRQALDAARKMVRSYPHTRP